jgi:hypothetical protein
MIKHLLAASLAFSCLPAFSQAESEELEMCVYQGPCAARVHAEELDGTLYLVKSRDDYEFLSRLWTRAKFMIVDAADYDRIRAMLPAEALMLPARNPATAVSTAGGPRPTPAPAPSGSTPQGPLVQGTVTVTVGGGSTCADCHTGSMAEIHKEVMKPKKDDK